MLIALLLDLLGRLAVPEAAPVAAPAAPSAVPSPRRVLASDREDALFARALAHVLAMEGGYSEDPYDPGGPTNLGITLAEFARWRGVHLDAGNFAALKADLRRLDRAEAARIYKANYWDAAFCGFLPAAVAVFHFDCAVNQGVAGAARMLQQALAVDIDARIGPITIAAAQTAPVASTLARYADARRAHYRSLSTFWRFGRGWLSRVDTTLALARAVAADPLYAAAKEPPMPETTETPTTPPSAPSAPTPAGKWWGKSMTVWGVIITSLSTVLPVIGPLFGVNITADLVQQLGDAVVQFGQAGAALVGLVLTLWGRARASQPLARKQVTVTL
jgi:lysozyme family protein